ncbi:cytochrome P450 [Phaeobacter sp. B1627]|uniref:cytochrome P450 n=1 Tax=Phaeobacter sp. B1627 TaxID=2583809 RepID=UPI00159ED6A6|nr:cytochrome P450 [Phaeobacter sp. B1627]
MNLDIPLSFDDTDLRPDLANPENYAIGDGLDLLAQVQQTDRVYWNKSELVQDFWAVTGWSEAREFFLDAKSFSSAQGMNVGQNDDSAKSAAGKMLIVTDQPRHRVMRRIIAPLLEPRQLAELQPGMNALLSRTIEPLVDGPDFDCVSVLTSVLPAFTVCKFLGVPDSDVAEITQMVRIAYDVEAEAGSQTRMQKFEANAGLFDYFGGLIERRRHAPQQDAVSRMLTDRFQGSGLTGDEMVFNLHGLITGGNETTRHASTGAILAFADHPEQWEKIRSDPETLPRAVEEVMRWTSPSLNLMRTCVADTVLAGKEILCGERVSAWFPIINRDPLKFDQPNMFRVDREENPHLTFGLGAHACVGGAMARYEVALLLDCLARYVARFERAGPSRRLRSNLLWGIVEAPVRLLS